MSENNVVSVSIYGSNYDIKGTDNREHVVKIANHVNEKMEFIAKHFTQYSQVMIAVLASVQITDELYKKEATIAEMERAKEKLLIEFNNKISMSEESKNSYIEQKQLAEKYLKNYQDSQQELYEKYEQIREVQTEYEKLEEAYQELLGKNAKMEERLNNIGNSTSDQSKEIEALKERNQEIENHFFDTQMENIQMKKQIEQLKQEHQQK